MFCVELFSRSAISATTTGQHKKQIKCDQNFFGAKKKKRERVERGREREGVREGEREGKTEREREG